MDAIKQIKKYTKYDCYQAGFSAITEDTKDLVNTETPIYSGIAVLLCLVVLCLGLQSWVAPIIFLIGIMFPIVYNMGTNVFLGQISYITQALALILQLAVTMDYSIFLLHRYQEEKEKNETKEDAMAKAIHATFVSITSSSVTTIAGFLALCAMQLTLGRDIGVVMAKGVVLGVICTILVLPSLLMAFDKPIEKYTHPVLIRPLKKTPKFVVKHHKAILIAFVVLFIPAIYCQANVGQYYDLTQSLPDDMASVQGTQMLKDKFNKLGVEEQNLIPILDDIKEKAQAYASLVCHPQFAGLSDFIVTNEKFLDSMHEITEKYIDDHLTITDDED
jgi:hypothetical protein